MSEKPKNIVEGVGYGVKRVLKNVEGAILGVFVHPIKGAQKERAKRFIKGTWRGISGALLSL